MSEEEKMAARELTRWPTVQHHIEHRGGGHKALHLRCGDRKRMVIFAASGSDRRAAQNHLARIRRVLRQITE